MYQPALDFENVGNTQSKRVRKTRTSRPRRTNKKKIHYWVEILQAQDVPKGWDTIQNTWAYSEAQALVYVRRRINRAFGRDEFIPVNLKVLVKH